MAQTISCFPFKRAIWLGNKLIDVPCLILMGGSFRFLQGFWLAVAGIHTDTVTHAQNMANWPLTSPLPQIKMESLKLPWFKPISWKDHLLGSILIDICAYASFEGALWVGKTGTVVW